MLILLFVMALIFPVLFYHHSWSLWLGFDFIVESLPKYDPKAASKIQSGRFVAKPLSGLYSRHLACPARQVFTIVQRTVKLNSVAAAYESNQVQEHN